MDPQSQQPNSIDPNRSPNSAVPTPQPSVGGNFPAPKGYSYSSSVGGFTPDSSDGAPLPNGAQSLGGNVNSGSIGRRNRSALLSLGSTMLLLGGLLVIAMIAGLYFLLKPSTTNTAITPEKARNFNVIQIPLEDLVSDGQVSVNANKQLAINGLLNVNNSLVLTPSSQPESGIPGQLYYNSTTNQLSYYNGTSFINISDASGATSLVGLAGTVPVGTGLGSASGSLVNTGVVSLNGLAGALNVAAGSGINITPSGSSTLTISSTGGGSVAGVSSVNGLAGALTVANASAAGSIITLNTASSAQLGLVRGDGSTVNINGSGILSIGQNVSTSATPTFANLVLSSPLPVSSGGTGLNNIATGGVLIGNGVGALSVATAGGSGLCFMSTGGNPTFQSCPSGGNISQGTQVGETQTSGRVVIYGAIGNTITNSILEQSGGAITSFGNFTVSGGIFSGNGSGLTNVDADTLQGLAASAFAGSGANSDITSLSGLTTALSVAQGGTGANSSQGAINNLSQLTTMGDLLYFNGANSTRLARGANGDCLTSNATTLVWVSCTSASGGANQQLSNLSGTVAINQSLLTGASTIDLGSDANAFRDLYLSNNITLEGSTADNFETTLVVVDPDADRTITFPNLTGTVCLTSGNCAGVGGTGDVLNNGQNGAVRIGSNDANSVFLETNNIDRLTIDSAGAATFSGSLTVTGATTLNGGLTIEAGDIFTFGGDAFDELVGTGLQISGGDLQTTLGTSVDLASAEVTGILPIANGGTNANNAGTARTNLGAAASGANSDITSLSGLTTALSIAQGGTGANSSQGAINNLSQLTTTGDLLYHNGSNSTRFARGANGDCLTSNATTIIWAICSGAGSSNTLQAAYDAGNTIATSNARDISLTLADTATDSNLVVNIGSGSGGELKVQNNGTDVLHVGSAGQLQLDVQGSTGGLLIGGDTNLYRDSANILRTDDVFRIQTSSTEALDVRQSGGFQVLHVDTSTPGLNLNGYFNNFGRKPSAVAGNGTDAIRQMNVVGGDGGNTTGTTGQTAGTGSDFYFEGGDGGNASTGSTNGNGGSITLQGGSPGVGTGAAGGYGGINLYGAVLARNLANSSTAFQIQNAAGTSNLFIADTSNTRIGIGRAPTTYALEVNGDSWTNSGFIAESGSNVSKLLANNLQFNSTGTSHIDQLGVNGSLDITTRDTAGTTSLARLTFGSGDNATVAFTNGLYSFRPNTDSTSAFQIQDALSNNILSVDSTGNSANLITNPSFEVDTSGWVALGGSTISRVTSEKLFNNASLQIAATANGHGGRYNITLAPGTYSLNVSVKASVSSSSAFQMGYASDGSTETNCMSAGQALSTTGWNTYNCSFVVSSTSGTPYIWVKQNSGAARNIWVDGIVLESGSAASMFYEGRLSVISQIATPIFIKTTQDSHALVVQGSNGDKLLDVDTENNGVGIGTSGANGNAKLTINAATKVVLQANASGAADDAANDLLQLQRNGTNVFTINNTGKATLQNSADSTNAFQIQNQAGTSNLFVANTLNSRIGIGTVAPSDTLEVVGNIVSKGTAWTSRTSAADSAWLEVAYGNGLFVAVACGVNADVCNATAGSRVKTSPDGINWTSRTSAADIEWESITYGNGMFVAVSGTGTGNRVMTSPDGVNWTSRTSAADHHWRSITYGNGMFVAVACGINATSCNTTAGNRVMTSPDGVNWTSRASAANIYWSSVAYGNGLFVAVAQSGTGNRVMTSPDGITWTSRTSAADNDWYSVTYGNGLFVATALSGTGNRVMTSPDGITWTSRTSAADNLWNSVTYGNGLFVAVASSGTGNRVMTSPDGINWVTRASSTDNSWQSVAYGNGTFVSVAEFGAASNKVMTSGKTELNVLSTNNTYQGGMTLYGSSLVRSDANSATAFRVQDANGNSLLTADTVNMRLAVGSIGTATGQFYVSGTIPSGSAGSVATGGAPTSVHVQGRYAYVANVSSDTMTIYDVSNPASPTSVGSVATGSSPYSVNVQGRYAYVANSGSDTMTIYDVSNPASPTSVGSVAVGDQPRSVYVQGRYAHVANYGSNTMTIIDVSNPARPTSVGSVGTDNFPRSVYVQGRYAYVTNQSFTTMTIYDVSTPSSPTLVGSVATGTSPRSVYVQGRYAYVANSSSDTMTIYDVSNPASPTSVGSVAAGDGPNSVFVQGRYAFVTNEFSNTMTIIDISNPASPTSVGSVGTGAAPSSVYVQGRYAFVTNFTLGTMATYDIGGAYIQQLEAGGIEAGTISARNNLSIGNDANIRGGLTVGGSTSLSNLGVSGPALFSNSTDSNSAFQIQNATGTSLFIADTTGMIIRPGQSVSKSTFTRTPFDVDTVGNVGEYTSMAIGVDGLPIISYYDASSNGGDIKIAHCSNASCSTSTNTTIDPNATEDYGRYSSIAIGRDGLPIISYQYFNQNDLRVTKCGNITCTSGNVSTTVDQQGALNVGSRSSIAIGADGNPIIAHFQDTNNYLRVTKCSNPSCTSGTNQDVDTSGDVGYYISIEVAPDGLPVISYYDLGNTALKIAKCGNADCSSGNSLNTVDNTAAVGQFNSLAIGKDGLPVISYYDDTPNGDLKVAKCHNATCSTSTNGSVYTTGGVGQHSSLAIGSDGNPVISFYDNQDLRLVKCADASCTPASISTTLIDNTANDIGKWTSIAIGTDGNPIISHRDDSGGSQNLRAVKCGDPACGASGTTFSGGVTLGSASSSFQGIYFDTLNLGREGARVSLDQNGVFTANGLTTKADGTALLNLANSSTALQIQNASGVILWTADTSSLVIKVSGTTSVFATFQLDNAHIKSSQSTPPTIGTPSTCGTSPTASITAGSTDSAGSLTINTGATATTCTVIVTFNKAYGAAPKSVMISAKDPDASGVGSYVSAASSTTFTLVLSSAVGTMSYEYYFWVVE